MKYIKCSHCERRINFKDYAYVDDAIAGIFCSVLCYARAMDRFHTIQVDENKVKEYEAYENPIKIYNDRKK